MNILTFDIEEWFHCDVNSGVSEWGKYEIRVEKGIDQILQTLSDRNQKATFFCLGWIASKCPSVVKKIHSQGHQLGCHSNNHDLLFRFSKNQFRKDTEIAIKRIEDITGEKILSYRAPAFSINENNTWVFEVLAEYGIEFDCSIFPSKHEYGGFPSFGIDKPLLIDVNGYMIKEFPMNTMRVLFRKVVFSGGGYFRLLPYSLISYWMKKSDYVMTYFHVRDFDPSQPVLNTLPIHRQFKSYVGLKNAFSKFEKLLDEFIFVDLDEANRKIDWDQALVFDFNKFKSNS